MRSVTPAGKSEPWTVGVTSYELSENKSSPQLPPVQPAQPPVQPAQPATLPATTPAPPTITPVPPIAQPAIHTQALSTPQQKQPPPTSPKPKFKANTLPRSSGPAQGNSSCPILPSWAPPPAEPSLKHHWSPSAPEEAFVSPSDNLKPAPMFKVARVEAKAPAATWQPTVIHNMDYNDSRNKFNPDGTCVYLLLFLHELVVNRQTVQH